MQMLLSANDMEAVVGSELLNGMETLESKIRKTSMNVIADGKDLLCESALSFTGSNAVVASLLRLFGSLLPCLRQEQGRLHHRG